MASFMAGNEALKATHQQLKSKMDSTVEDFRGHLLSTRTGRANVHMLDQIKVDYYGTDTPVAQMGQVSTPEPTLILVQPYDMSMIGAIEKAIRTEAARLGADAAVIVFDRTRRVGRVYQGPWWDRTTYPIYGRKIIAVAIRYRGERETRD